VSTSSQQAPDTAASSDSQPLALVVELDPADDAALLRVLSLLARRRCAVVRAAFAPEPSATCHLLSLELRPPGELRQNVVAWISGLVPVRAVRPV